MSTRVIKTAYQFPMRIILLILALLILSGFYIAYHLYNKPQRSVEHEVAISISAKDIFSQFEKDETVANNLYLNKAVSVTGTITDITSNQEGKAIVILETDNPMFGVSCTLDAEPTGLEKGSATTIKGICTGFLSDVVITRGVISKKE